METFFRDASLSRSGVTVRFFAATFFAFATAVCARISFHTAYTPVPITLQVFGVILSGLVLGRRWGAISQIQYLMLGAMGAPVFAGGLSGPIAFAGPSGGYLFGFIAGAYLAGLVSERVKSRTASSFWIAGIAGMAAIYALGASWLAIWLRFAGGKPFDDCIFGAWRLGIVPFIGIDLIKAVAASGVAAGGRSARGLFHALGNL